ncbi:MAG: hypothetical protein M1829_000259 [Trizodia sp. TS-e1964]|nr:MAG: hypothetical protein M1829_000259 [Trizodia sp. TS-e1964]
MFQNQIKMLPVFRNTLALSRIFTYGGRTRTFAHKPPYNLHHEPTQSRVDRIFSRRKSIRFLIPKVLQRYGAPLRAAPISHLTSFLVLHELTAIVPLFGLAACFHYTNWLPPYISEGQLVSKGVERFGKWFRKRGWLGPEAEGELLSRRGRWWGKGESGLRLVVEFGTAMATTEIKLDQLPQEMLSFNILKSGSFGGAGYRIGKLLMPGRKATETPNFLSLTSRGIVPHLSQDSVRNHTNINGVFVALEDFIERAPRCTPPIFQLEREIGTSALRSFISLSSGSLLVLGPRRNPPVPCSASNTNTSITILTSVGFSNLESDDYAEAAKKLQPDIVVGLGDVVYGDHKSSVKRIDKMGDRTIAWTADLISALEEEVDDDAADEAAAFIPASIFAPILPIETTAQSFYLDQLQDEMLSSISGLAIYSPSSVADLPPSLQSLPRLSLYESKGPHELLNEISLGIDLLTIPFISTATDAGIALDFSFPNTTIDPAPVPETPKALGIDMWSPYHAVDVSPLQSGCKCYTCTKHHRAYIQHLLMAKEMLAWVLLQLHNHHIMDVFFAAVRESIAQNTFEADCKAFGAMYEPEFPEQTGQGPRVRGYQFKSEGNDARKNVSAYGNLERIRRRMADTLDIDSTDLSSPEPVDEIGFKPL